MDRFSFFFAFYGLILGLAVAELLGGFAGFVRHRQLRQLEPQTAMLALVIFLAICGTWLEAWGTLQSVSLDFSGLWAPVCLATAYYLAAAVVFPKDAADLDLLDQYFAQRKGFVVAMLFIGELLINFNFRNIFVDEYRHRPAVLWLFTLPYSLSILTTLLALFFVRSRRWNIVLLAVLVFLFLAPSWESGAISGAIKRHYGY